MFLHKVQTFLFGPIGEGWTMKSPMKKGGSYSIYYKDKHIANVRGKTKALVLIHALKGINITDNLDMG